MNNTTKIFILTTVILLSVVSTGCSLTESAANKIALNNKTTSTIIPDNDINPLLDSYAREVTEKVMKNWLEVPAKIRNKEKVILTFRIRQNGKVSSYTRYSGNPKYETQTENAALSSIMNSSPFSPPPDTYNRIVCVKMIFDKNTIKYTTTCR